MAWAGVATGVVALILNISPNKKLFGYGFIEQMKDVVPFWLMSAVMFVCVISVSLLRLPTIAELIVMVAVGVAVYVLLSVIFKVESFNYILNTVKPLIKKFIRK